MFRNKKSISTLTTKEFDVLLPPDLAKNPNLDKATVRVEESQIIIQLPNPPSPLPELWIYIPRKSQWSAFKFRINNV
jgi:hypothetical protein